MTPPERLARCRAALGGLDSSGEKTAPSMFDPDVISFAHGEGVRRPHPAVVAAGVDALLDSDAGALEDYQFLRRWAPLEDRITEYFADGGIQRLTSDHLCVDSGTSRLFCSFLRTVTEPGDTILVARTYYHLLISWCELFGLRLECVPTAAEDDFKLTATALEDWYSRPPAGVRPRAVVLFNPTQTGAVYTGPELESLAEVLRARGLAALEDTVFRFTEFPGVARAPFLAAFDRSAEIATVGGGSKAYGLANVRIGWACGPPELMREMRAHAYAVGVTVPHVAQAMAAAALAAPAEYVLRNSRECSIRAGMIASFLGACAPGVRIVHTPLAGHSVLLDLNGYRGMVTPAGIRLRDSVDLLRHLLTVGKVAVSPGLSAGFDDLTVRLCFGCVGARHTYRASRVSELASVGGSVRADVEPEQLTAGFARAREDITEGLTRITTAMGALDASPGTTGSAGGGVVTWSIVPG
jgi:aspartate aminotransferase